jgi:hypothetical protein
MKKKVIRLTESDVERLVKKILKEDFSWAEEVPTEPVPFKLMEVGKKYVIADENVQSKQGMAFMKLMSVDDIVVPGDVVYKRYVNGVNLLEIPRTGEKIEYKIYYFNDEKTKGWDMRQILDSIKFEGPMD